MNIILIAPPAGGKGTQSEFICSKYNMVHISTGDLLRKEVASGNTELKKIMDAGMLVDDDIILDLIKKNMTSGNYLLDGFPRNEKQACELDNMLDSMGKKIDYVFLLDVSKEVSSKRIVGRRTCPKCNEVYNIYFEDMMPKVDGRCDKCQTELVQRCDDNYETYESRYNMYLEKTKPLIDYYEAKGVLYTVDANKKPLEIFKQIEDIVGVIK